MLSTKPRPTMTNPLNIEVLGEPIPQGSMKAFVRGKRAYLTSDNPRLKAWREAVTTQACPHAGAYTGERPLHVTYRFILTRPKSVRRWLPWKKPDLDKLIRAVNDGLGDAGVWDDDSRVTTITAWKIYEAPGYRPGAFITIREEVP